MGTLRAGAFLGKKQISGHTSGGISGHMVGEISGHTRVGGKFIGVGRQVVGACFGCVGRCAVLYVGGWCLGGWMW